MNVAQCHTDISAPELTLYVVKTFGTDGVRILSAVSTNETD